jgi:hypothetical protein
VEEREIGLLLGQYGQKIGERGENGEADAPAIPILRPKPRDLPYDVGRRHVGGKLAMHCLGDDEPDIVGEAVLEPLAPVRGGIGMAERGLHPDLAVAQLHRAGRNVVRPQIEGAAAFEIESGVVPVTGQDAVLDATAFERESHVRAAIVECEDAPTVIDDEDRTMVAVDDEAALRLELLEARRPHEFLVRRIHEHTSRRDRPFSGAGINSG